MKYQRVREAVGQVEILKEKFDVVISFNIDCDNEAEIYKAIIDTGLGGMIDIIDSWLQTVNMVEQLENIIWRIEK